MKNICFLFSLVFCSIGLSFDTILQSPQYFNHHKYPVESHIVQTEDHCNLQFYRIQAKNTKITSGKRVVYMQHGLVDSSDTWIINDEPLAPAFHLANQGFDVWLGNNRGNRYSNSKLSPQAADFWNFTVDEMGKYDIPAAIHYINQITGRKIHYISHSQGALIMLMALIDKSNGVQDLLLSFNAFGPTTYLGYQKSTLFSVLAKTPIIKYLRNNKHIEAIFFATPEQRLAVSTECNLHPKLCQAGLTLIAEQNNTVNNVKRMPVILGHYPSGTSSKNMAHYQQFILTNELNKFDYGTDNQKMYGQAKPPSYDLSKVDMTVHLYVGNYDRIGDIEDCNRLFRELTNSPNKTIRYYDYGHATFIWGKSLEHVKDALAVINNVQPEIKHSQPS